MLYRKSVGDKVLDVFLYLIVFIVVIATLYPIIYIFSMSISNPAAAIRGDIWLFPKGFSTTAYRTVLATKDLWRYYYNTLWYTVVGTILNVIVTILAAYPLSKQQFRFRKFFMRMITFTMFFSGGMIPLYLMVVKLGLYNTRWALILPGLTTAFYIIIARTFFMGLPNELFECARLEGASEFRILWGIALPLSKPIMAVLTLYYAVGHWNSYFPALLYLSNAKLHPLQIYLRRVVIDSSPEAVQEFDMSLLGQGVLAMMQVKYAVIIVAIAPIIMIYPLLQKYFVKGMLIGSLKD